jgi:competence protein ComFC
MIASGKGGIRGWLRGAERWFSAAAPQCLWCGGSKTGRKRAKNGTAAAAAFGRMERLLCAECLETVPWITEIRCAVCGRYEDCPDCIRRKSGEGVVNRSAVRYDPFMKEWLARYKYRGSERLEPLFCDMIGYAYGTLLEEIAHVGNGNRLTAVSYIPLSGKRLSERGFNQAEKMAAGLCREHRLPLLSLLVRTRHTEKQSYKSRRERLESLDQAFAVDPGGAERLLEMAAGGGINVILVDDVYTTGSTLNQCAEVLGADLGSSATVYGLTWAR